MNNSFISMQSVTLDLEEPVDLTAKYRAKESELIKIIAALNKVIASPEWQYLQGSIFKGVVDSLKRDRELQIEKQPLNGPMIHNLNGQIKWAKKYLDLSDFANIYKQELMNIRKQLNAKDNSDN